jgi:DnaJ-class molecular chaperone
MASHYATLGLDQNCSVEQIRDAYRILVRRHHPDLNPGDAESAARIREINAAREILGDPQTRRAYDEALARAKPARRPRAGTRAVCNVSQDVHLRIEEFIRGVSLEIRVNDPGNPDGAENYTLEIPAGTAPGAKFRLARDGAFRGGHVLVRVKARPDARFKPRGSDLRCDLRVQARRAAQGGSEMLPGPTGRRLTLIIPPGVARGEVLRIEGEGLPRPRGGRGDLLVRVVYKPIVHITRRTGR